MLSRKPPKLNLAHLPTPLRPLRRLSSYLGGPQIWMKCDDLSGFTLSGNKVRKLEFLLADAVNKGADTVITCGGIQSNHCRATAFACAQLGLKCRLILRDDLGVNQRSTQHQANHFLDGLCGAEIQLYSKSDYAKNLQHYFAQLNNEVHGLGGTSYSIPVGGSNPLGAWGYIEAIHELSLQCEKDAIHPDALVCATGSGGTQAGLLLGQWLYGFPGRIKGFAVCDSEAFFKKKIHEDILACAEFAGLAGDVCERIEREIIIDVNDKYIGPGYAQADSDIYDTISLLARLEGAVLDPTYTGKAMHGLISEIQLGHFADAQNLIFIHTGGVFGLFPHAEAFSN